MRRGNVIVDMTPSELAIADIYSFGLILHEIYGRSGVFGEELMTADGKYIELIVEHIDIPEIINRVKYPKGSEYFRPDMSLIKDAPIQVRQMCIECWNEHASSRPTISRVRTALEPISVGM